jgi:trehalose 6-phosphate synthase/phosphatase
MSTMKKGKLIIVSNRLPLSIQNGADGITIQQSSGGLVSAIKGYLDSLNPEDSPYTSVIWAGVPDCSRSDWERAKSQFENSDIEYLPVFLEKVIKDAFYNRFSNSTLWPLFHYFPSFAEYSEDDYLAYQLANEKFSDALFHIIKPEDTLWIHDYHLFLLPAILRNAHPKIAIGFFLHIPFPSFEVFRMLPNRWRRDLLNGILGADLVGFHTHDDVIYFLQNVQRLLGIIEMQGRLNVNHRLVQAASFPISIDFNKFSDAADDKEVQKIRKEIQDSVQHRKIIFSVDRLDYTKGLMNRLEAYEYFLTLYSEFKRQVVFILNIVPSRDALSKYSERKRMVDEFVGNINSRMGDITWQPVLYRYQHLDFKELMALYTACDIAMITPLRDGMNLVAKEFVAARKDNQGVLILSEFAGSAKELTNAVMINPNDQERIARKLHRAIVMSSEEQRIRMSHMREYLAEHNVLKWANDIFFMLNEIKERQEQFQPSLLHKHDIEEIIYSYQHARNRLILLDYDGTLVDIVSHPSLAKPTEQLIEILKVLSSDPRNSVFVVSGRKRDNLDEWLGGLPIGMIAEHGAFIKWPNGQWTQRAVPGHAWKKDAMPVMERFTSAHPGSFIEEKEFAIAWHYRNLGEMVARDAAREMYYQLQSINVKPGAEVIHGHKVVEIRSRGANKGAAYSEVATLKKFDFVLAAGDDRTDEDLFYRLTGANEYTIRVGSAASFARYNVPEPQDVIRFLTQLSERRTSHEALID